MTASLRAAAVIAAITAGGNLLLAIAHLGIEVPLLSRLGPQGGAVPPAVVAFTIGAAIFTAIAVGLSRGQRWAWVAGLVMSVLTVLSTIGQFRGVVSVLGILLALALAAALLLPGSREQVQAGTT
jgi:hypothetical protein